VGLAIFGPEDRRSELAATAELRGITWCTLPITGADLRERIETAATNQWWLHNSRAAPR
jgi:hypothetical protein